MLLVERIEYRDKERRVKYPNIPFITCVFNSILSPAPTILVVNMFSKEENGVLPVGDKNKTISAIDPHIPGKRSSLQLELSLR